jgi:hypothetical protein
MLPEVHVGSAPSGSGPAVLGAILGVGGVIEGAILDVGGTLSLGSGAGGIAVLAETAGLLETAALLATLGTALGVAGALELIGSAVVATVDGPGVAVAELPTAGPGTSLLDGELLAPPNVSSPAGSPPLHAATNKSGSMLVKRRDSRADGC